MGTRVRSTKHEKRRNTKSGVVSPGRSKFGSIFGGKWRHAVTDASKTTPETGQELVIMPILVFENKRDEVATIQPENEYRRVLYQDSYAFWSGKMEPDEINRNLNVSRRGSG